jgi:hypothetical protein
MIYSELHPQRGRDLWILPFDGPEGLPGKPIPFLTTPAYEQNARFSPDGKWIAYTSDVTSRAEAFIRAFPGGPAGEWPVSDSRTAESAGSAQNRRSRYKTGTVRAHVIRAIKLTFPTGVGRSSTSPVIAGRHVTNHPHRTATASRVGLRGRSVCSAK